MADYDGQGQRLTSERFQRLARGAGIGVDDLGDVVLQAAVAARPKLRYTAGPLAGRLGFLRRFAPASMVDGGVRKSLKLDALPPLPTPVLAKSSTHA